MSESRAETAFLLLLKNSNVSPRPEREYRFDPNRQWRFDFAWPGAMTAVEVDGVAPTDLFKSRHQSETGFCKDCEKLNHAAAAGWTVFRCPTTWLRDYAYFDELKTLIEQVRRRLQAGL